MGQGQLGSSLEGVQPGASPLVVAGEADLLLGEEDEAGRVLDLAQWRQVVVQLDLLAVLGLAVGHHVRLEL